MRLSSSALLVSILPAAVFADLSLHGARNRFWKHIAENKELIVDGVNHYASIEGCLDELLTAEDRELISSEQADRRLGLKHAEPEDGSVFLVAIENAITPTHAKALTSLAACVRKFIPQTHEVRHMFKEFSLSSDPGLGGNTPTHLAPLVGVFFPAVAQEMQRTLEFAYEAAGWSQHTEENGFPPEEVLPEPKDIGFRACEFLSYKEFKEGLADHIDGTDTSYTFNYALSGPEDYSGGYYYIRFGEDKEDTLFLKPNKYDALIFLGGRYVHGVTEITSGHRQMFSSELWHYNDAPFGSNLWTNYANRMREYVKECDEEIARGHTGPCTVDMTEVEIPEDEENGEDDEDENSTTVEKPEEEDIVVSISKNLQKAFESQVQESGLEGIAFDFLYNNENIGVKGQRLPSLADGSTWIATMQGRRRSNMVMFEAMNKESLNRVFPILREKSFRGLLRGITDALGMEETFVVEHAEVTAVSKFSDYDVDGKLKNSVSPFYKLVLPLRVPRSGDATFQTDQELFDLSVSEGAVLQHGEFFAPGVCNFKAENDFQMYLTIHLAVDRSDLIPAGSASLPPSIVETMGPASTRSNTHQSENADSMQDLLLTTASL